MTPLETAARPTHTRYWVIVFALLLAVLSYIDRVALSQAAPYITRDLGLSKDQMGRIFGAFGLAYALFEIPGGWLGDWIGPRRVLMRIVLWWSTFTALMGWMWNFSSMWVVQFFFGAGEAGGFPNLTKAFSVWLPQRERVRAQGILWTAARWAGAFTAPLVFFTLSYVSWHWAFVLFGLPGFIWAAAFFIWYRDNPRDHPAVNQAELALLGDAPSSAKGHGDVPWGKLIASRSVVLLWVQYFCLSFPWYFYITWLPTYLREGRHLSPAEIARLAILPLFFGGLGCFTSGLLAGHIARWTGSVRVSRRLIACTGFLGASLLLAACIQIVDPFWAMITMGLASFCNDLVMPPAWGSCMDIGGKYAGTVSGSMNMMGNLAGFAAPVFGGYVLQRTGGNWNIFLYTMAGIYLVGVIVWPFIDPVTPLDSSC
ncbi:MAG TPA: MFS transporter [Bryobacteraceae bacterium]|nr:MFS transporter [Bryobacteraceae bacterium]